jgi:hypothetical protein
MSRRFTIREHQMARYASTKQMRSRIVKTLSRGFLEELSEKDRPHLFNRAFLESVVLTLWERDTIDNSPMSNEILDYLGRKLRP